MGYIINLKADTGLVDRSENTTRFYKDIRKFKTFTKEEEVEWFTKLNDVKKKMLKTNDKALENEYYKIRDYIADCNQRLVVAAAKNYATTETLTDYINEANFGLLEAIDEFKVEKGWKFATYASWFLLRAINKYKYGVNEMVKKPNFYKTFHVISKAKNGFIQKYEREPTEDELLEIINNVYKKNIVDSKDLLDINYTDIANSDDDENSYTYGDVSDFNKTSASYNDYEKKEKDEYNSKVISSLLNVLKPREKLVIEMRFGLYDGEGFRREYKTKEIAEKIGLTQERVRQIEKGALKLMEDEHKRRISKYK